MNPKKKKSKGMRVHQGGRMKTDSGNGRTLEPVNLQLVSSLLPVTSWVSIAYFLSNTAVFSVVFSFSKKSDSQVLENVIKLFQTVLNLRFTNLYKVC